jgi:transcriptional regulator with XRE-family HTH domain
MKSLRLKAGHFHYEKFALNNDIARSQYRKYEMGGNITYQNLMKVIKALKTSPAEFFREGFE